MPKNVVPTYVGDPLQNLLDYWRESTKLLHAAMTGISVLRAMPNAIRAVMKATGDDEDQAKLATAKESAEFAEKECASGFPLLHAHTVVGCWGALEVSIEDMLVNILMNEPPVLQNASFSRLRVPLSEFEALDKEERMRLLLKEVARSSTGGRRSGIDGFEVLLASIGLSGPVDEENRRVIWEMNHVRNVIVHRASLADRKIVQNCPWLSFNIADKVVVPHQKLMEYGKGLANYVLIILRRACVRYGVDVERVFSEIDAASS